MTLMEEAETKMKGGDELEKLIDKAIKKVHGEKENDLCKFIPGPKGGYMHHFTLRKLKHADPKHLTSLLQEFILEANTPRALDPKPRAPRGSRKKRDVISFTRNDIERVLELARKMGDKDLVAKLSPKRSLPSLKRELLRSIRSNVINQELWNAYAEAITAVQTASSQYQDLDF